MKSISDFVRLVLVRDRALEGEKELVFLELQHEYLPDVVTEAWIVPENTPYKVFSNELVPVYQMLQVNFK